MFLILSISRMQVQSNRDELGIGGILHEDGPISDPKLCGSHVIFTV